MWCASVVNTISGAFCASSATCWSFVETSAELEVSAIFPSRSSVPVALRFPPRAPHGMSFPASPVPSECSDFPLPVPTRFVASRDGTAALDDGDRRSSQVPGEPRCVHAPLSDPGGTAVPGPLGTAARPSACSDGVGSHEVTLSRLNHAACMLPVYASRPQLPAARATLGSGCGPALPDGIGYPLGSTEKFPSSCHHYMTSPFPRLVLAHVGIGRRPSTGRFFLGMCPAFPPSCPFRNSHESTPTAPPQIRTCPIKASGSSRYGLAA